VTKNIERLEWFLEKATELGIQQITPFISKHGERHKLRMDRLEKIIRTAGKQSGNPYFPKLNEMVALKKLIEGAVESQKFIAHLDPTCQDHLFDRITPQQDCLVLIGPEGDFGREEILLAQQHDFKSVHLGENRLRTETAGIYATQCILLKNKS
jgi:16S rRNA (uracil1498-N3)-methyltransferase